MLPIYYYILYYTIVRIVTPLRLINVYSFVSPFRGSYSFGLIWSQTLNVYLKHVSFIRILWFCSVWLVFVYSNPYLYNKFSGFLFCFVYMLPYDAMRFVVARLKLKSDLNQTIERLF